MPVTRLVREVADNAQVCTQRSWKRPYGVGLLVAGQDKSGPRLFYCCPSGNYYEYLAHAIGGRSQVLAGHLKASCILHGALQQDAFRVLLEMTILFIDPGQHFCCRGIEKNTSLKGIIEGS